MSRFLKVIASTIALASVLSLNGCSSGSDNGGPPPTGILTGGLITKSGTAAGTTAIPATGGATITVIVDGVAIPHFIPSGFAATVTPDTPLLVIPKGSQPLKLNNTTSFKAAIATTKDAAIASLAAGGDVSIGPDGKTDVHVAIPLNPPGPNPGDTAKTPLALALPAGNVATRDLGYKTLLVLTNAQTIRLNNGTVQNVAGFPQTFSGKIPQNGENTKGANIVMTLPTQFVGSTASLTVVYDDSHSSVTTTTIGQDGTGIFNGFGKNTVPGTGVNTLILQIY